jgi:hypothetical protein
LEPIAGNFDFPPGTEVYWKKPGTKNTPAISTTRIVPGNVAETNRLKVVETEEAMLLKRLGAIQKEKEKLTGATKAPPEEATCEKCGVYKGTRQQVHAHGLNCKGKQEG